MAPPTILMGGFIDPTNPAVVTKFLTWDDRILAYTGLGSDVRFPSDQGCKGAQLPGDKNVFYCIAKALAQSPTDYTYLVKAKFLGGTTIQLSYKVLPGIQAINVTNPNPNQLAVTSGGRVFIPVGSYGEYEGTGVYYYDVTGTTDDDPDNWTITARYTTPGQSGTHDIEGSWCMAINHPENKICILARGMITAGENQFYSQFAITCAFDGSTVNSSAYYVNLQGHATMPLNTEAAFNENGGAWTHFVFCGVSTVNPPPTINALNDIRDNDGTIVAVALNATKGKCVAAKDQTHVQVINKYNECNTNPNQIDLYTWTGGVAWVYTSQLLMVCPQATPQHFDSYRAAGIPWTASGSAIESGAIRENTAVTGDYEETANYRYNCTAGPRTNQDP